MKHNLHTHKYPDGSDSTEYVIESSNAILTADPKGGYVTSWKVKHPQTHEFIDILYRGSTKKRTGIPILFPYFGKAKAMRQHGFGRDSEWKVGTVLSSHISLELLQSHISDDARKEYLYHFHATLQLTLEESGSFIYSLAVKNTGAQDLPISPGMHPYWDIKHEEKKKITVEGIEGFDASAIDWDKNPPDNDFPFKNKGVLHFPDRKISIEDISEGGPEINHLVIWSQPIDKPDFNFVCVEPVCGVNFTIDEKPIIIPSNHTWKMSLKFSVEFIF